MYYSFDIFDTCLIRTCGFAHNVFDLLALQILGDASSESHRADFVNIRVRGEKIARSKKNIEITLEDIYNECNFSGLTDVPNQKIAQEEMNIERRVLVEVKSVQRQIDELHRQNYPIYFISDMYLPESFIKSLLKEHRFWKEGDKLYVSSTSGKTKHDGSLFDLVAVENQIRCKKWHHWGDNLYSDFQIPCTKGIKAHLVNHGFSIYEKHLLEQSFYPGNFINQQMAGIQKAIRLSFEDSPQVDLAANITIPLLVSFVYQIMEDAKKSEIRHLFFLSRDGYLPFFIANQLQSQYPEIDVRYIYTSRSALYFPGAESANFEDIIKVLGQFTGKKMVELFIDRTNIDISPFISEFLSQKIIESEGEGKDILFKLYENSAFRNKVNSEYKLQKDLVLKYFIQNGLATNRKDSALCDIRGTRKCHNVINRLLEEAGYTSLKGYYLEVTSDRKVLSVGEDYFSVFYAERYRNTDSLLKGVGSLYAVIEQYFCATGSLRTIKYAKNNQGIIEPVYEIGSEYNYGKDICDLHKSIAEKYIKYYIDNRLDLYSKELIPCVHSNFFRFSRYPYMRDLQALLDIRVNDDRFLYSPLVHCYSIQDIINRNFNKNEWTRGSLVFTIYSYLGEKLGRKLLNYVLK
ncbi:MAG: hypothetical protein KH386_03430 [Bacteroides sp.]|nr:hypothetical protein [Bacteroides sp.]